MIAFCERMTKQWGEHNNNFELKKKE